MLEPPAEGSGPEDAEAAVGLRQESAPGRTLPGAGTGRCPTEVILATGQPGPWPAGLSPALGEAGVGSCGQKQSRRGVKARTAPGLGRGTPALRPGGQSPGLSALRSRRPRNKWICFLRNAGSPPVASLLLERCPAKPWVPRREGSGEMASPGSARLPRPGAPPGGHGARKVSGSQTLGARGS